MADEETKTSKTWGERAVGLLAVIGGITVVGVSAAAVAGAGYSIYSYGASKGKSQEQAAIEAQYKNDGRYIPGTACLRYSINDKKEEMVTVSDACKGTLSLDLVVAGTGTARTISLNTGNYRVEGTQAAMPTISQKIPETYKVVQSVSASTTP